MVMQMVKVSNKKGKAVMPESYEKIAKTIIRKQALQKYHYQIHLNLTKKYQTDNFKYPKDIL